MADYFLRNVPAEMYEAAQKRAAAARPKMTIREVLLILLTGYAKYGFHPPRHPRRRWRPEDVPGPGE